MPISEFTVTFHVIEVEETGQSIFLSSDLELDQLEFAIEQDERYYCSLLHSTDLEEVASAKSMLAFNKRRRWDLEQSRKNREGALAIAKEVSYVLKKPMFKEYIDAESETRTFDARMNPVVDRTKLMKSILPGSVKGISVEQFEAEMEPDLANRLWNKLNAAMFPTEEEAIFMSWRAKTRPQGGSSRTRVSSGKASST